MNKTLRTFINLTKKPLRTLRKILALFAVKLHKVYKTKKLLIKRSFLQTWSRS